MAMFTPGAQYGAVRGRTAQPSRLTDYLGALAYGLPDLYAAREEQAFQRDLATETNEQFTQTIGILQEQIGIQQRQIDEYVALSEKGMQVDDKLAKAYEDLANSLNDYEITLDQAVANEIIGEDEKESMWGNVIGAGSVITSGTLAALKIKEAISGAKGGTAPGPGGRPVDPAQLPSGRLGPEGQPVEGQPPARPTKGAPPQVPTGPGTGLPPIEIRPKISIPIQEILGGPRPATEEVLGQTTLSGEEILGETIGTTKPRIETLGPEGGEGLPGKPGTAGLAPVAYSPAIPYSAYTGVSTPAFAYGEVGPSIAAGGGTGAAGGGATLASGGASIGTTLGVIGAFYGISGLVGKLFRGIKGETDPIEAEAQKRNVSGVERGARGLLSGDIGYDSPELSNIPLWGKVGDRLKKVGTLGPKQIEDKARFLFAEEEELGQAGAGTMGLKWKRPPGPLPMTSKKIAALRL
jgi:hypothetical protein